MSARTIITGAVHCQNNVYFEKKTLAKTASFVGKTPKIEIRPHFVINYETHIASIASFGSCGLFHSLWRESNHYRGQALAKQGHFWKHCLLWRPVTFFDWIMVRWSFSKKKVPCYIVDGNTCWNFTNILQGHANIINFFGCDPLVRVELSRACS